MATTSSSGACSAHNNKRVAARCKRIASASRRQHLSRRRKTLYLLQCPAAAGAGGISPHTTLPRAQYFRRWLAGFNSTSGKPYSKRCCVARWHSGVRAPSPQRAERADGALLLAMLRWNSCDSGREAAAPSGAWRTQQKTARATLSQRREQNALVAATQRGIKRRFSVTTSEHPRR